MNAPDGILTKTVAYGRGQNLQSQLHSVSGRSAAGDLTIRPLSSIVDVLRMNTDLLAANREIKFSPFLDVITSFALSLIAWISDRSILPTP